MKDTEDVLSERTLRYGRNINFICFIALAMILTKANLSEANLFGAKTSEQNIWIILLLMLLYQFGTFLYLGSIDWKNWKKDCPFCSASFTAPGRAQEVLDGTGRRTELYHWSLFLNKKTVLPMFLKDGHTKVSLHDNMRKKTEYGWLTEHVEEVRSDREAFVIDKGMYEKYRVNYLRWLFLEFGIPYLLSIITFCFLVAKIQF